MCILEVDRHANLGYVTNTILGSKKVLISADWPTYAYFSNEVTFVTKKCNGSRIFYKLRMNFYCLKWQPWKMKFHLKFNNHNPNIFWHCVLYTIFITYTPIMMYQFIHTYIYVHTHVCLVQNHANPQTHAVHPTDKATSSYMYAVSEADTYTSTRHVTKDLPLAHRATNNGIINNRTCNAPAASPNLVEQKNKTRWKNELSYTD